MLSVLAAIAVIAQWLEIANHEEIAIATIRQRAAALTQIQSATERDFSNVFLRRDWGGAGRRNFGRGFWDGGGCAK